MECSTDSMDNHEWQKKSRKATKNMERWTTKVLGQCELVKTVVMAIAISSCNVIVIDYIVNVIVTSDYFHDYTRCLYLCIMLIISCQRSRYGLVCKAKDNNRTDLPIGFVVRHSLYVGVVEKLLPHHSQGAVRKDGAEIPWGWSLAECFMSSCFF